MGSQCAGHLIQRAERLGYIVHSPLEAMNASYLDWAMDCSSYIVYLK